MHPLLTIYITENEEEIAKKAGRNRGLVSIAQRSQSPSKPGMIPGGTRSTLDRVRRERERELTAGLATRATAGGIGGGALAALAPVTAPYAIGAGLGVGLGETLNRTSRLNTIARYLNDRAKKKPIVELRPRRGIYT